MPREPKKKCYFKGTEPSPKGFGMCARNEKIGKKEEGTDGRIWIVRVNKNGVKTWRLEQNQSKSVKPIKKSSSKKSSRKPMTQVTEDKPSVTHDKPPVADKKTLVARDVSPLALEKKAEDFAGKSTEGLDERLYKSTFINGEWEWRLIKAYSLPIKTYKPVNGWQRLQTNINSLELEHDDFDVTEVEQSKNMVHWKITLDPEYWNKGMLLNNYKPKETEEWKDSISAGITSAWMTLDPFEPPKMSIKTVDKVVEIQFKTNLDTEWLRESILHNYITKYDTWQNGISTDINRKTAKREEDIIVSDSDIIAMYVKNA